MADDEAPPFESALDRAQELCFDAWDSEDPRTRIRLARKALELCPHCADAYVILANEAQSLTRKTDLYRKGVEAGERALGPAFFKEEVGHFWAASGTRPYMRARLGLAQSLWRAGQRDAAISHFSEMLRLNPNDNQGVRYPLSRCLLLQNRDSDAADILNFYESDGSADWCYTWALMAFRKEGDSDHTRDSLWCAIKSNYHVPAFLLAKRPLPAVTPEEFSLGYESEAACYAADNLGLWRETPGALDWLTKRLRWDESERHRPTPVTSAPASGEGAAIDRGYSDAPHREAPARAASALCVKPRKTFTLCVKCGAHLGKGNTSGHCRRCGARQGRLRERELDAAVGRLVHACREAGDIVTGRLRGILIEQRRQLDVAFAQYEKPISARLSVSINASALDGLWRREQYMMSLPPLWIAVQGQLVHLRFLNAPFQCHTVDDIRRHFESAIHREHPDLSVEWLDEASDAVPR
jgi:tetratricopeptide (TPR) repeat protein